MVLPRLADALARFAAPFLASCTAVPSAGGAIRQGGNVVAPTRSTAIATHDNVENGGEAACAGRTGIVCVAGFLASTLSPNPWEVNPPGNGLSQNGYG